jgi:AcrR family transcriptional regulator
LFQGAGSDIRVEMVRKKRLREAPLSSRLTHILTDLERIIVAEGFLHLDTATLAKRLRCSKRALYTLAPTQEQLLTLAIQRVLQQTDEYLARAARGALDWRAALTTYMSAIVQTSRPASPGFLRDIAAFPPGMRLLNRLQRRTTHRLEQIIRSGIAAGAFNDISPRLVAELILMAAGRLIDPDFLRNLGLTLAEAYEELSRLLDHGLLPLPEFPHGRAKRSKAAAPARSLHTAVHLSPGHRAGPGASSR